MRSSASPVFGSLPAGMPWFMTVFGRDTIITCLQTMLLGTDLARAATTLASLQAKEDNPEIDAEPEDRAQIRTGKAAKHWFAAYYGTVDATPLYLVLLSEVWRWTDDAQLVRRLREPLLAMRWIDEWGDRDGDGFVEYEKRSPHGLDQPVLEGLGRLAAVLRRKDGRAADRPPRCRATSTTRSDGRPSSLAQSGATARSPTGSPARPTSSATGSTRRSGSTRVAATSPSRSTATSRRIDWMTSNMGHLLWSGSSSQIESTASSTR